MIISCGLIFGVSILMGDTPLSIFAAITGMLYTLIAGKGKRSCYFFGIINSICYAIMSLEYKLYGEMMLYGGYYLVMMFVGFFMWNKKLQSDSTIIKTRLSNRERILGINLCLIGGLIYGVLLFLLGGRTPGLDSATNVLSAAAMILTVKRCIEQWYLWMAVNAISICMWGVVWFESGEASALVVMYAVYLISAFIFYFDWRRTLAHCANDSEER